MKLRRKRKQADGPEAAKLPFPPPERTEPVVTIEGELVRAELPEGAAASMKLADLFARLDPGLPDSRGAIHPDGLKCLLPRPDGRVVAVHQTPPRVHGFRWIAPDSQAEFGPGTSYRHVRLALPYVVVLALFEPVRGGGLRLGNRNECFFVNQPLDRDGLETALCYPALLNCSRFPDAPDHPLAWICTQHLDRSGLARPTPGDALRVGLEALLHHLLESGFNRSSEHNEGASGFSEAVAAGIDARIASVETWEEASAADPLFVLDVPWIPTGRSLAQVVERLPVSRRRSAPRVACAEDIARLILHANAAPAAGSVR